MNGPTNMKEKKKEKKLISPNAMGAGRILPVVGLKRFAGNTQHRLIWQAQEENVKKLVAGSFFTRHTESARGNKIKKESGWEQKFSRRR